MKDFIDVGVNFDYVITVCDHVAETRPVFTENTATEEEALGHYRRIRDEIKAYVETLPAALE